MESYHCIVRILAQFAHRFHHLVGRPPAADGAQCLLDVDIKLCGGKGRIGRRIGKKGKERIGKEEKGRKRGEGKNREIIRKCTNVYGAAYVLMSTKGTNMNISDARVLTHT